MNCEESKQYFVEYWAGALSRQDRAILQAHLDVCPACQAEAEQLGRVWETLGEFPEVKPSPELRARFSETLAAYQLGLSVNRVPERRTPWWHFRPAWQFGLAAATLAIGLFAGHLYTASRQNTSEVASLRQELSGMRQMVTLSLLQQQNATDRLRGVSWSERVNSQDTEVLSALLYTLNHDQSVNVRLSAADALSNFSTSPLVRKALPTALEKQDSPLVQAALIDTLASIPGKDVEEALRLTAANQKIMQPVRERALRVLKTRQGDMQ